MTNVIDFTRVKFSFETKNAFKISGKSSAAAREGAKRLRNYD